MQKLIRPHGLTTDVVIFTIEDGLLKTLLIKRVGEPFNGEWALPGVFLFDDEGSQDAASRILKNKAGVKNIYLEQLYTFDDNKRDPRGHVCTVAYFALVPRQEINFESEKNIQTPALHPVKNLPHLAFDHKKIVDYATKRLRSKIE